MNAEKSATSLENQLLIAMPQLLDPYFANTVTYLCKHNEEGALGIVINKPLKVNLAGIFEELDITYPEENQFFQNCKILEGGPVEQEKGFIIYRSNECGQSALQVADDICLSTSRELLQDIADGKGPEKYLVALGCAGWEAGQLEREISNNVWLTSPAPPDLVFSNDYNSKADQAAALLGIDLSQLSPAAGHS